VHRAERAGYRAILLTVDAPRFGNRERGLRAEASLPPDLRFAHFEGAYAGAYREPEALSWEDVAWLRSVTELPILLKGVLHPEDAAHAVEHGASGVIVSTHGGRQLDAVPASIEALPAVVEAVGQGAGCTGRLRRPPRSVGSRGRRRRRCPRRAGVAARGVGARDGARGGIRRAGRRPRPAVEGVATVRAFAGRIFAR
jgi:hypothetical protein